MYQLVSKKFKSLAFVALLLGSTTLAFVPILVRLSETSPSTITFWRMLLSTPVFFAVWLFLPSPKKQLNRTISYWHYLILLFAGISFTIDLVVWNTALNYTSIAHATLLVNFASLFLALISWLILRKPLGAGLWMGMFTAIIGSMLLVWPHLDSLDTSLMGDGLSLLAACFYALYLLFVQIARQYFGTLTIMAITGLITTMVSFLLVIYLGETIQIKSMVAWYAMIGLASIQIIGQGLVAYSLSELSATLTSIILLSQPAIAAIIAWKLFDEGLVAIQLVGMVVIIAGIAFAKIGRNPIEAMKTSTKEVGAS